MPSWLEAILEWLIDVLLWVPRQIFKLLLEALAALINAIPVPSFLVNLSADLNAIFANLAWFAELIMLPEGATLIIGAMFLRFLIRRIPLVG